MLHLYVAFVWCICICCICMLHLYDAFVCYICMLHLYVAFVWCICMLHLYAAFVCCICMLHLYAAFVCCICMMQLYTASAWRCCMELLDGELGVGVSHPRNLDVWKSSQIMINVGLGDMQLDKSWHCARMVSIIIVAQTLLTNWTWRDLGSCSRCPVRQLRCTVGVRSGASSATEYARDRRSRGWHYKRRW